MRSIQTTVARHGRIQLFENDFSGGLPQRVVDTIVEYIVGSARFDISQLADVACERGVTGRPADYRLPFASTLFEWSATYGGKPATAGAGLFEYDDQITGVALIMADEERSPTVIGGFRLMNYDGELQLRMTANDRTGDDGSRVHGEELEHNFMPFVDYALLMLDCKNVTVERVLPSRQERRQRERAGLPAVNDYRIVVKVPGHQQITVAGPRRVGEPMMPAHMVRGHFSEYSEERPLFGKYTGRFWIPAHVRGRREDNQEVRAKDYVVVPDKIAA